MATSLNDARLAEEVPIAVGMTGAALWFRRVVLLGVVANVSVALVSIVEPAGVIELLGLEPAVPLVWPRFAAFLLILLSAFYALAAVDPFRHFYSAVFAVVSRFAGVGFFLVVGGRYIVFGLFDLAFGLPQAVLLFLAWRSRAAGKPAAR